MHIYFHYTVRWALTGGQDGAEPNAVTIGNRVLMGLNTVSIKGITVGGGAVIGDSSSINTDIPAGARSWGSPARCWSLLMHRDSLAYVSKRAREHDKPTAVTQAVRISSRKSKAFV